MNRVNKTNRKYIIFYTSSRATLKETYTAKYIGVLPRTPQVRPKSEIYTAERDEHPRPFHMGVPPQGGGGRMQQLPTMLGPAVHHGKDTTHKTLQTQRKPCVMRRRETKEMGVVGSKV